MTCDCGYPIAPPCKIIKDGFFGRKEVENIEDYTCSQCGRTYKIRGYKGNVIILEKYTTREFHREPAKGSKLKPPQRQCDDTIDVKDINKYIQLMKQGMSDEAFKIFETSINKSLPSWAESLTTDNVSEMRTNNINKAKDTGLTEGEQEISDLIVQVWNKFTKLEKTHPSDLEEVQRAIHMLQSVLAMRTVRRDYPNQWVNYKDGE